MPRPTYTSGFIYLWYDRKHKRFYLGKHWGPEDDGYVCSSKWMKRAYQRRPQDFGERKILERVTTNQTDLAEAERRWGAMIKPEELGKRYYNLNPPGRNLWHDNPETKKVVSDKIADVLKNMSPEKKQAMHEAQGRSQCGGKKPRVSKALKGVPLSEERRRNIGKALKGKPLSEEHRRKISESRKKGSRWQTTGTKTSSAD